MGLCGHKVGELWGNGTGFIKWISGTIRLGRVSLGRRGPMVFKREVWGALSGKNSRESKNLVSVLWVGGPREGERDGRVNLSTT